MNLDMKAEHKKIIAISLIIVLVFFFVDPIYAGPGGAVAKAFFKTWWGKLIGAILVIIFFPLIIYIKMREYFAVKKCKEELKKISRINDDFRWSRLEKNVKQIFERVYLAWSKEDMSKVSDYVSHWYWQNQQLVYLDKWKSENLKNICDLQSVGKIKPLHLEITDNENLEGSRVAFSITGRIKDYLVNRTTHKIIKGNSAYDDEEKVWIFEYTDGKWLLDDIREGDLTLAFAKLENIIPTDLPSAVAKAKKVNL
jgi:hypothetical protein